MTEITPKPLFRFITASRLLVGYTHHCQALTANKAAEKARTVKSGSNPHSLGGR